MPYTSSELEDFALRKNPDLIFLIDEKQKIRFISRSARNVLQIDDTYVGRKFSEILHPADHESVSKQDLRLEKLWTGECHIAVFRFNTLHKKNLWVQVRIRRLLTGKTWLFLSARELDLVSDFERKILENEAALTDAENVGNTGSWWINLETQKNHWSRGNFKMYDLPPADEAPPLSYVFGRLHPDDVKIVRKAIEDVKQEPVDIQLRVKRLDKEGWRYMLTRIRPFMLGGDLKEVKGVNFDITELVASQMNLEEQNRMLEEQNTTLRKYIQLNSHEVRSPLSNLLGLIELMEAEPDLAKEFIAHLRFSATRLDQVIRDINETLSLTAYKNSPGTTQENQ